MRASFIGDPPDHSSRQATTGQSLPLPGLHSEGQVRLRLNAVLGQSSSTPSTPQTPQSAKIHDTQKIVPSGEVHKEDLPRGCHGLPCRRLRTSRTMQVTLDRSGSSWRRKRRREGDERHKFVRFEHKSGSRHLPLFAARRSDTPRNWCRSSKCKDNTSNDPFSRCATCNNYGCSPS